MTVHRPLELLAPAKNAEFGIEAIVHGADAVYIGGPAFGARANAGNPVAAIETLATFAHRYNARVLVALNTLIRDDELEIARTLVRQVYEAGADALIVQDMGLLELDLPPIELHASTQCDIRSVAKAQFLEAVGFSQMVLARELSLAQVAAIRAATTATLEFFVHGALCVSYSGCCNLSHAQTGRSANRGDCSQPCRLPYALVDADGTTIAENQHLLSLKDNDQSGNLRALIAAGISSFKIEGRLKDLAYVKNVTAHYRREIDAIIAQSQSSAQANLLRRTSSGASSYSFRPEPAKTFNRGATDYFVNERSADIGAFASPKFVGEEIGSVSRLVRAAFEVQTTTAMNNGDGLSYFSGGKRNELVGMRVNTAEAIAGGWRLSPTLVDGGLPPGLAVGTTIYRNHDQAFMRVIERKSAERKIAIDLLLRETADGFALRLTDDRGVVAEAALANEKPPAQDPERALSVLRENLGKLGNTIYAAATISLELKAPVFVPASLINALRRDAVAALDAARARAYTLQRPVRAAALSPPATYPENLLSYLGNVLNQKARAFYLRHGVTAIEPAFECGDENDEVSLMITKHCLRYSFNLCPKQVKGIRPEAMTLKNADEELTLRFDCKPCEMHVVGRLKRRERPERPASPAVQPITLHRGGGAAQ